MCDKCPKGYHRSCDETLKDSVPETWLCVHCRSRKTTTKKKTESRKRSYLETFVLESKSMLGLVLYMELVLSPGKREKMLDMWMAYKRNVDEDFAFDDELTAQQYGFLCCLKRIVGGKDNFDRICNEYEKDGLGLDIISGFGGVLPRASMENELNHKSRQTRCGLCGESRIFRTRCYHCNTRTSTQGNTCPLFPILMKRISTKHSVSVSNLCRIDSTFLVFSLGVRVESFLFIYYYTGTNRDQLRLDAIERGLARLRTCIEIPKHFRILGGDMLFLSQKLDIALSRACVMNEEKYKTIHERYHDWLEKTAKRWMAQCNSVPADAEVGDILNIVEGIHATKRLNLMDDEEEADEDDDNDNQDHEDETPTKNGRIQRTASKKAQELLRVVRTMERNHDNRRRRRKGKGRKRKKKQRKLQDFGGGT